MQIVKTCHSSVALQSLLWLCETKGEGCNCALVTVIATSSLPSSLSSWHCHPSVLDILLMFGPGLWVISFA